jgi:hypothetical protein
MQTAEPTEGDDITNRAALTYRTAFCLAEKGRFVNVANSGHFAHSVPDGQRLCSTNRTGGFRNCLSPAQLKVACRCRFPRCKAQACLLVYAHRRAGPGQVGSSFS